MKLLIAGSGEVWSLEKHYLKYLKEAGVEVQLLPVQSIFYKYYNHSIVNKILYKLGLSRIDRVIANQLQQVVSNWKPDVMWVFKGMELSPDTLKQVKAQGIKLVNYNPDNPFIFSGRGSGNKNITNSIALYDLHFSYDTGTAEKIQQDYNIPCKILPFGFELSEELYTACTQQEEIKKVCFVGNPDSQRGQFLNQLSEAIPVEVYGEGWSEFVDSSKITVHAAVYGDEFWKTLYRYRVQLNLMRVHNPTSHNMRSFEVPGVGGIGLFPHTPDHATYFEEGKEIFLYRNINECIQCCKALLGMTAEEESNIRRAARLKSIQAGYSYRDRTLQALREIKGLLNG
ncbi:MAG TPA: glycosyltransferase [Niastella sp.]